jgi:hypothetical protein
MEATQRQVGRSTENDQRRFGGGDAANEHFSTQVRSLPTESLLASDNR